MEVKAKLKQCSKYVILAFIFDYVHYDLWGFFPDPLQVYVYDSSQSIAFLLYIYAICKFFDKDNTPIMYAICTTWLWFSVGDAFTMVYFHKTLEGLRIEYYCMWFNVIMLCYKFRGYLYLQWEIFKFNLKIDRYEGVLV